MKHTAMRRRLVRASSLLVVALAALLATPPAAWSQGPFTGGGVQTYSAWTPTGYATLAVTTSSARVALGSSAAVAWVCNTGSAAAHVRLGSGSVVALVTDFPVLPAQCVALAASGAADVAAITDSGTATLLVSTGSGHP